MDKHKNSKNIFEAFAKVCEICSAMSLLMRTLTFKVIQCKHYKTQLPLVINY